MADYGFRISKTGVDVKTGDDKDMIITSKYSCLKGFISGGGVTTVTSGTPEILTITHNLGYIPFGFSYFYNSSYGDWWIIPFGSDGPNGHLYIKDYSESLHFHIYIDYVGVAGTIDVNYKYFIFLDKGKL